MDYAELRTRAPRDGHPGGFTLIEMLIVTALIGGPFFLYLLRTRRGGHGF